MRNNSTKEHNTGHKRATTLNIKRENIKEQRKLGKKKTTSLQ